MEDSWPTLLSGMNEDGVIRDEQMTRAESIRLPIAPQSRVRRVFGFQFVDQVSREAEQVAGTRA